LFGVIQGHRTAYKFLYVRSKAYDMASLV